MNPSDPTANKGLPAEVPTTAKAGAFAQENLQSKSKQVGTSEQVTAAPRGKFRIWTTALLLGAAAVIYYFFRFNVFALPTEYLALGERLTGGLLLVLVVLLGTNLVSVFGIRPIPDRAARYNLNRVLKLVVIVTVAFAVGVVLFADWYTTIASIGLITVILGFALQKPTTSFIGWVYVLVRKPYQIGDRIQIGQVSGDVVDVSYFDTTLLELGGSFLSTGHPSGRVVKFPNSKVLEDPIYNYSWAQFPYIWNEIRFHIGYDSDLDFVAETMEKTVEDELGEAMVNRVELFRDLMARTLVDELHVRKHPSVIFRPGESMWIEAIVRYLVLPREAGKVKNRLVKVLLDRLNAQPDRARFPKVNFQWK
jgi:small-conductance mechanosensitive channel